MRLYTAFQSKTGLGVRLPAWSIPAGKLKFETSVTFERQEERSVRVEEVGA